MFRNFIIGLIVLFFYSSSSSGMDPKLSSNRVTKTSVNNMSTRNADPADLTIDMQKIDLQDALHILGRFFRQNIIISSDLQGPTTLYLRHVTKEEAIQLILSTHNLTRSIVGRTWIISSRADKLKRHEEEKKQFQEREEFAPLSTEILQIHYAKANELAQLLEVNGSLLSKRGRIKVDIRTNALCVQDIESRLLEIKKIIHRLDVPVEQVLIEARLVSVDQDFEQALGIHFETKMENSTAAGRYSLAIAKLATGSQLDIQLAALESQGHGEVISSPSLFTSNQQPAFIEAGEEIPYQEVSKSGGTAIAFKKAVLSLKVTPQLLSGRQVLLQLQVNQDRPNNRMVLGVPAITTRQIKTQLLVGDGQTIVLGGIYETNAEQSTQRIPFLGKIPLVGWLFKQQNVKENKRELLIFVTPKMVASRQH